MKMTHTLFIIFCVNVASLLHPMDDYNPSHTFLHNQGNRSVVQNNQTTQSTTSELVENITHLKTSLKEQRLSIHNNMFVSSLLFLGGVVCIALDHSSTLPLYTVGLAQLCASMIIGNKNSCIVYDSYKANTLTCNQLIQKINQFSNIPTENQHKDN